MADETKNVTTVFRVDVAQFKRNIAEANAAMKLANAEFEAATAGMEDWSKTSEGLEKKIKQLADITEANNKMMEAYKGQLEATRKAKAENVKQAEKLRKSLEEMAEAGQDSKEEYKKLAKELASVEKEIAKAEKAESDLTVKMLKTQAAASKSEKEMGNYGKQLDELKREASGVDDVIEEVAEAMEDASDAAEDAEEGFTIFKGAMANLTSDAILKGLDLIVDGVKAITEGLIEACTAADNLHGAVNNFSAQTGIDTSSNPEYEQSVKNIYADNYGEDFADIADSMATINQITGEVDSSALEDMTRKALLLRDTFEFDIQEQMRAVDGLMKQFGVDSETAFNLVVQGAQNGLNRNGDLLDTLNEYSVQFAHAGYSAEEMFNMLANGVAEGTWSVDKLGDAVKEFNIRMTDGSAKDAVEALGFSWEAVSAGWSKGGAEAKEVMSMLMNELYGLEDTVDGYNVGVGLMGTMFEDLGYDAVLALSNTQGEISATKDALTSLNDIKYDSVGAAMEGIKRQLETSIEIPIGEKILPKISDLATKFGEWLNNPDNQAALDELTTDLSDFVTGTLDSILAGAQWFIDNKDTIIAGLAGIAAGFVAFEVASVITSVTTALQGMSAAEAIAAAKTWLLNSALLANPIALIVALIAGLIAAFVALWTNSEEFREFWNGFWEGIKEACGEAGEWIGQKIDEIGAFFTETLPDAISGAIDKLFEVGGDLIGGLIEGLLSGLSGVWNTICSIGNSIVEWFMDIFDINSPSRVMRDKIGKMLPPGIGIGVEANAEAALKSIRKLGKSMVDNLDVSGISDKLSVIKEGFTGGSLKVATEAVPAVAGVGNNTTYNNKTTTYAPTYHYNKPLNAKEIYRQDKKMLSKIVGVEEK